MLINSSESIWFHFVVGSPCSLINLAWIIKLSNKLIRRSLLLCEAVQGNEKDENNRSTFLERHNKGKRSFKRLTSRVIPFNVVEYVLMILVIDLRERPTSLVNFFKKSLVRGMQICLTRYSGFHCLNNPCLFFPCPSLLGCRSSLS